VWSEVANSISRVVMYIDASNSVSEVMMDPSLVNVYPNPSSGVFNLQMNSSNDGLKMKGIEIYNMYGAKVYSNEAMNSQINTSLNYQIELNVTSGIYFLHVQTEQGRVVKKIVISK